jgi:hypothetical protein
MTRNWQQSDECEELQPNNIGGYVKKERAGKKNDINYIILEREKKEKHAWGMMQLAIAKTVLSNFHRRRSSSSNLPMTSSDVMLSVREPGLGCETRLCMCARAASSLEF